MSAAHQEHFAVDFVRDPEPLVAKFDAHLLKRPCGRVDPRGEGEFAFRRDPDALQFMAIGFSIGLTIMMLEVAHRAPGVSVAAWAVATCSGLGALALMLRYAWSIFASLEVRFQAGRLQWHHAFAGRRFGAQSVPLQGLLGVRVVSASRGRQAVVLVGPQHRQLAEFYRVRSLDPLALAPWLAKAVAIGAQLASAREEDKRLSKAPTGKPSGAG